MKRKINENKKVTLTFGQLKRLITEATGKEHGRIDKMNSNSNIKPYREMASGKRRGTYGEYDRYAVSLYKDDKKHKEINSADDVKDALRSSPFYRYATIKSFNNANKSFVLNVSKSVFGKYPYDIGDFEGDLDIWLGNALGYRSTDWKFGGSSIIIKCVALPNRFVQYPKNARDAEQRLEDSEIGDYAEFVSFDPKRLEITIDFDKDWYMAHEKAVKTSMFEEFGYLYFGFDPSPNTKDDSIIRIIACPVEGAGGRNTLDDVVDNLYN